MVAARFGSDVSAFLFDLVKQQRWCLVLRDHGAMDDERGQAR